MGAVDPQARIRRQRLSARTAGEQPASRGRPGISASSIAPAGWTCRSPWSAATRSCSGLTFFTGLDEAYVPKLNDPPRVPIVVGARRGDARLGCDERRDPAPERMVCRADRAARPRAARHARGCDRAALARAPGPRGCGAEPRCAAVGRSLRADVPPARHGHRRARDRPRLVGRRALAISFARRAARVGHRAARAGRWDLATAASPPYFSADVRTPDERGAGAGRTVYEKGRQRFDWSVGVDFEQTIGGPDAFALYAFSGALRTTLRIRDDTWMRGIFRLRFLDNYEKFTFTGPSNLPRVRTFLREYLTTSDFTMPNAAAHACRPADATTSSTASMAATSRRCSAASGRSGSTGRSPAASRSGSTSTRCKQRNFEQDFGFRDYSVVSGHATRTGTPGGTTCR